MMEKIIFYTPDSKQICEVIMPYKNVWNWMTVLKKLTSNQLEEVRKSFWYYYKELVGNNNDWLTCEDLEDLDAFEDALIDFSSYTEDVNGLYTLKDVETREKQKCKQGITIRQLYKLADAAGALDVPITATFFCEDDWYSFEDEPLTEDCLNIDKKSVNISM